MHQINLFTIYIMLQRTKSFFLYDENEIYVLGFIF